MNFKLRIEPLLTALAFTLALGILASLEQPIAFRTSATDYRVANAEGIPANRQPSDLIPRPLKSLLNIESSVKF